MIPLALFGVLQKGLNNIDNALKGNDDPQQLLSSLLPTVAGGAIAQNAGVIAQNIGHFQPSSGPDLTGGIQNVLGA